MNTARIPALIGYTGLLMSIAAPLAVGGLPHVAIVSAASGTASNRVLYNGDIQAKLMATGLFSNVTILDTNLGTGYIPTLAELQAFDAVLTFSNGSYENSTLLGDRLADYVDAGGGVVVAVFAMTEANVDRHLRGRWLVDYEIMAAPAGATTGAATLGTIIMPGHPIMNGVNTFQGGTSFRPNSTVLRSHGELVAQWSDGRNLVAVSTLYPNRVDLGMFPVSSDGIGGGWAPSTDGARLMANALVYTANAATSTVISSNLSSPGTSGSGTFIGATSTTIYKAVGWTMPATSYSFRSATLAMDFTGNGQAIVSIWSGATLPQTRLVTLSGPPQTGIGDFRFTSPTPLLMEAGSTYWLYVESIANPTGSFYWAGTTPSVVPTGVASHAGYIFNGNPSVSRNRFEILGRSTGAACYANCDGSTIEPILNIDDFTCFINEFATAQTLPPAQQVTAYANCDGSTIAPVLNIDDFTCFINAFAQGCP